MTPCLQRELISLSVWIASMLFFGAIFDSTVLFLFLSLIGYIIWTFYNLNRLTKWLSKPSKKSPESIGLWDEVYYQLYHQHKRHRKSRRKLTRILTRFQKSTQALPNATIVLNKFNEIEWLNPAAVQLFSLRVKHDIGQRIDNLIRQPEFAHYIMEKKFDKPLEFEINNQKILLNMTPYGNGKILMSARDITQHRKLDDMRRDFISNASHELRTPLTVMSGYIEILQENTDTSIEFPLEKIQQQTDRMKKIINELIELAKIESSSTVDNSIKIDSTALLTDVYNEAVSLDDNRHNLKMDINPVILNGNYEELRMAISNLLTNAIRYTPDGGDIKLFTQSNGQSISIGVMDSGIGIKYKDIPRLTERFYRVDLGRARKTGGTGLGLAIVKQVLDRHGASLTIMSELNKGSTFRCDFSQNN